MQNKKDDTFIKAVALQLTYLSTQDLCLIGRLIAKELETRSPDEIPENTDENSADN